MTLYIIHGWTYDAHGWDQTIAELEKSGIKVKFLKVPGLTTPSSKVFTIEDYVDWAEQHLPNGAIALGHSNGGRILMNLAIKHPKKLKHLILLSSAGVYAPSRKARILRPITKALSPLKNIPGARRVLHKLIGASDYQKAPENMKKTLRNMLDSDKNLDISKVQVPTTILWGAEDTVTPPDQGRQIHKSIKNSTWKLIKGWPHAPYLKHPEELAHEIEKVTKSI